MARLILIPANAITVTMKLSTTGQTIDPKNSFSFHLTAPDAPFVNIHEKDATWIEGYIRPDGDDCRSIEKELSNGGSLQVQPALRDHEGNLTTGAWNEISLEGRLPMLNNDAPFLTREPGAQSKK
jgi:hypothetical protein